MKWLVILGMLAAGTVSAQEAMTGDEFEAAVAGKTMRYFDGFTPFGTETYLDGRRVRWAFEDDTCVDGTWAEPEPGLICFTYEAYPGGPHCWSFFATPDGIEAVYMDDPPEARSRYLARPASEPLFCPGPRVGS